MLASATTSTPSSEPSPTLSRRESRRRRCASASRRTTRTFAASSSVSHSGSLKSKHLGRPKRIEIADSDAHVMYCVADILPVVEQPSRSRRAPPTTRRCASRSCRRSWPSAALSALAAWKRQILSSAARRLSTWNCRVESFECKDCNAPSIFTEMPPFCCALVIHQKRSCLA